MTEWHFSQPKNIAVLADMRFIRHMTPCLYVSHDYDDGGWQFLASDTNGDPGNVLVVALSTAVSVDPTLNEIADLPEGWIATRIAVGAAWQRMQHPKLEE